MENEETGTNMETENKIVIEGKIQIFESFDQDMAEIVIDEKQLVDIITKKYGVPDDGFRGCAPKQQLVGLYRITIERME